MKLHDKEKEKKKWLPGKIVENRFSHLCFYKSSTSVVSVDPSPLTPPYQIIRLWNSTLLKERGDTFAYMLP